MSDDLEKIMKWYELTRSTASSSPPKKGLLSSKCPKCGAKLKKETVVHPLYAEEGAEGFANKVIRDHSKSPGLYSLTINHFICGCGYLFADRRLEEVESES
jgi:hypothetical protein